MSIRLKALCSLIPVCKLLIDVGCDHGFVAGYALANGLCERAIASDISEGSLSKARKNLSQFPNAQTRLGDGLSVLKEGEDPDVIVIAGMGGSLICEILALYRGGAKLILECVARGGYPSWDAQNRQSLRLAERLGYHFDRAYPVYEIFRQEGQKNG